MSDGEVTASDAEELRRKLHAAVETAGERYFVDPSTERVGDGEVEHWRVLLGAFTYLSKGNALLVGDPGTGKTTFANVVASVLSGLPFDLFARTQIQGHPDQTKEEMLARAHVGKLTTEGREEVVWQNTLFLPQVLIDEFNRLPEGKQSILQEFIRTGSLAHLNEVFYRGEVPFVATVNLDDRGTYAITHPNRDRFDVSVEFTHGRGYLQEHVQRAHERIQADLVDAEATIRILDRLSGDDPYEERLSWLDAKRTELRDRFESLGLAPFAPAEERRFLDAVGELDLSGEAAEYLEFLYDEFNLSSDLEPKRRSDDPRRSTHDRNLAYGAVETGISARRRRAIASYARMLAFYLGAEAAGIDHVRAVAPYCLAHTLEFADDFRAEGANDRSRSGREAMALTRTVLAGVHDNYEDLADSIRVLNRTLEGADLDEAEREAVERLLYGTPEPDHPHLKVWIEQVEPVYRREYGAPDAVGNG